MQLYEEITEKIREMCPKIDLSEALGLASYQTLAEIKAVLEDERLNDAECFLKIEEIINLFEALGSGIQNRHDFG